MCFLLETQDDHEVIPSETRLQNTYPFMRVSFRHTVKYPFVHRLGLQSHLQVRYELSDKVRSRCFQWFWGVMACHSTFTVSSGCPTASPTAPMINSKEMWPLHIAITHYYLFLTWVCLFVVVFCLFALFFNTWQAPCNEFQNQHSLHNFTICQDDQWALGCYQDHRAVDLQLQ